MVVRLEKQLEYADGSPLQRLLDRGVDTAEIDLAKVESAIAEREDAFNEAASTD